MNLILYDGVCGLCSRLVRFVAPRDKSASFRFATIQGPTGRALLEAQGRDPDELDTLYAIVDHERPEPEILERSDAVLFVLKQLGWPWRAAAAVSILPRGLLNAAYDHVAARRNRLFGGIESCRPPEAEYHDRFLDG